MCVQKKGIRLRGRNNAFFLLREIRAWCVLFSRSITSSFGRFELNSITLKEVKSDQMPVTETRLIRSNDLGTVPVDLAGAVN